MICSSQSKIVDVFQSRLIECDDKLVGGLDADLVIGTAINQHQGGSCRGNVIDRRSPLIIGDPCPFRRSAEEQADNRPDLIVFSKATSIDSSFRKN